MAMIGRLITLISILHLANVPETIARNGSSPWSKDLLMAMCRSFDTEVKTLEHLGKFYDEYTKINDCLHLRTMLKDANEDCMLVSEQCERNGLLYSNVKELGQLLRRFNSRAPICTVEFSMRIYHLHNRLVQIDVNQESTQEFGLLKLLRVLANRSAARCRLNLPARLQNAESRAPDTSQHITLIYGLLTGGKATDGHQTDWKVEPEHYVPILEREQALNSEESIGRGTSGYDFKLKQEVKVTLEATKISCRALRAYHTNLIGSLGLLASLGYAAPSGGPYALKDTASEARVRRWTLSAIICQSLLSISKMSGSTVDGKLVNRIRFLPNQTPEIGIGEELETVSFRIPETATSASETLVDQRASINSIDTYRYSSRAKINLRKFRLIYGPNYSLSKALYTYLDYTEKERSFIPFEILGIEKPVKLSEIIDEEEEEEEE